MTINKHLILILCISMIFPLLAACDAEQPADPEESVVEATADNRDTATPTVAANTKPESTSYEAAPILGWDDSMSGKYLNEKYPSAYIELKTDGTFVMTPDPRDKKRKTPYTGDFSVDGDQLTLSLGPRLSRTFRLEQDAIVSPKGMRFLK